MHALGAGRSAAGGAAHGVVGVHVSDVQVPVVVALRVVEALPRARTVRGRRSARRLLVAVQTARASAGAAWTPARPPSAITQPAHVRNSQKDAMVYDACAASVRGPQNADFKRPGRAARGASPGRRRCSGLGSQAAGGRRRRAPRLLGPGRGCALRAGDYLRQHRAVRTARFRLLAAGRVGHAGEARELRKGASFKCGWRAGCGARPSVLWHARADHLPALADSGDVQAEAKEGECEVVEVVHPRKGNPGRVLMLLLLNGPSKHALAAQQVTAKNAEALPRPGGMHGAPWQICGLKKRHPGPRSRTGRTGVCPCKRAGMHSPTKGHARTLRVRLLARYRCGKNGVAGHAFQNLAGARRGARQSPPPARTGPLAGASAALRICATAGCQRCGRRP